MLRPNWEHKANGLEVLTGRRVGIALKTAQTIDEWAAEQEALADEFRSALMVRKLDGLQVKIERAIKALGLS